MGRLILINSGTGPDGLEMDVYIDPLTEHVWTIGYFPNAPKGHKFIPLQYRPDLPPDPRQRVQPIPVAGTKNGIHTFDSRPACLAFLEQHTKTVPRDAASHHPPQGRRTLPFPN